MERLWPHRNTHINTGDADTIAEALACTADEHMSYLRDGNPVQDHGAEWPSVRAERIRRFGRMADLATRIGHPALTQAFERLSTVLRDEITMENVPEPLDIEATVEQAKQRAREAAGEMNDDL